MLYGEIKRVQAIQLEMLDELDRVCKALQIEYFIIGGTALGAVRHAGFIPWDDDIDVAMIRDHYERFLTIAPAALAKKYFLQTPSSDPKTHFAYAKLRKHGTVFAQWNEINSGMHRGIYVDIFPYDRIPDDDGARRRQFDRVQLLHRAFVVRQSRLPSRREVGRKGFYHRARWSCAHYLLKIFPKTSIVRALQRSMTAFEHVNCTTYACLFFPKFLVEYVEIEDLYPLSMIEFCGKRYPCAGNIDAYLRNHYGNYMQLPDQKDRVNHRPAVLNTGD